MIIVYLVLYMVENICFIHSSLCLVIPNSSVCLQCGRPGFNPWVGKIPWRRKWQSTAVLLPEKSHGQRSLVGYSPWGLKESDTTERLHFHFPIGNHRFVFYVCGVYFCFVDKFICITFLDSTCKQNHTFVFLCRAYLSLSMIISLFLMMFLPSACLEI